MTRQAVSAAGPIQSWDTDASTLIARHCRSLTRIDAVAPDILRVRLAPSGQLPPARDWDSVADLPRAPLAVRERQGQLLLSTGNISARLALATGALTFSQPDGADFASDRSAPTWRALKGEEIRALAQTPITDVPAGAGSTGISLNKRLLPHEGIFGCGQRFGPLNRRGRRLSHWTIDINSPGLEPVDGNLYQAHPVLMVVRPGLAWGLFLHSSWYSAFDAGAIDEEALTLFTLGGSLDYYVLAGPTPAAVVEQLTRLTGRPVLPPLWAMGYHQSRWSYGSDTEARSIAEGFRDREIPLDAIHLDIDYMDGHRVFTWDRERFPDPAATIQALHSQDIRAVAIVDPGVKRELGDSGPQRSSDDARYWVADRGVEGDHFIREPSGELFSGWVWPGESLFPDFCSARTRRWWGESHAGLVAAGVDGIWCDMNEPAIVDRPFDTPGTRALPIPLDAPQGDNGEGTHAETHNLYGLLMARATHEGLARLRPLRRPWVLTRSGGVGVQSWSASWMGDNVSSWEDLRGSLPQLASMGLSGSPHVGVDIGGFYGDCSSELFARWIELGAFYPFMRCHTHHASRAQEPWAFGTEVEALARAAIALRYRLLPYLYTLAHRAERSGEPLLRPLVFDFPDSIELQSIDDQLMVGPHIMIAPVCSPGVTTRPVELPPGTWYDFHTGTRLTSRAPADGNTANLVLIEADAPLGRMPIFVRGGACLTLGNDRQSTADPVTELTLDAYPDERATGRWSLIEDAGDGLGYRSGECAETELTLDAGPQGSRLRIGARGGRFVPPPRDLRVRLHLSQPPACLSVDDQARSDWHWDEDAQAATLTLADNGMAHRLVAQ